MAANRRHQSAAVRFAPALKAALLVLLLGGSAVGYVYQKNQLQDLGRDIGKREQSLKRLREENQKLGQQVLMLRSPVFLERRVKEMSLGLTPANQTQILRIVEEPSERVPSPPGLLSIEQPKKFITLR